MITIKDAYLSIKDLPQKGDAIISPDCDMIVDWADGFYVNEEDTNEQLVWNLNAIDFDGGRIIRNNKRIYPL